MSSRRGFTMVEIMLVILVVGTMASIAAPPMFRYVQSSRLQTEADRLAADLQYARSVAISRGQILQFNSTAGGYTLIEPISGDVIRDKNFDHDLGLAANQTANFFPWGMADATVFNLANGAGNRQINLLPTGIVEVH